MTRTLCTILPAALSVWLSWAATAAEPLRLVTGNSAPFATGRRDGFFDLVVAEMFGRIGVHAEVRTHVSSARALVNAGRGEDDGLVARICGLEMQYPSLVIVPEKIFDNDFVAFTLGPTFPTPDWRSLESCHIAYIRGWQIFEADLTVHRQVTRVSDAAQLFELVGRQRVDGGLCERWQALWYARALPVRVLEPPLARAEMFGYLHRKHAALAPRAAAALAAMKRDGSYARIFNATLGRLETPQPP
ncbi:MAG: hypothetical protein WAO95_02340 [Burkholderiales bacterium]